MHHLFPLIKEATSMVRLNFAQAGTCPQTCCDVILNHFNFAFVYTVWILFDMICFVSFLLLVVFIFCINPGLFSKSIEAIEILSVLRSYEELETEASSKGCTSISIGSEVVNETPPRRRTAHLSGSTAFEW